MTLGGIARWKRQQSSLVSGETLCSIFTASGAANEPSNLEDNKYEHDDG
jgi:hypothetical protein